MIAQLLGHCRILEKIGAGGMGEIYRAHDELLDRDVAIKVLPIGLIASDPARQALIREARLASSLNHPNICTIYEVGEFNGQVYIVMEYVQGRTLGLIIGDGLPTDTIVRYAIQITDAVIHAHARGVIHRDLKSSNVIISLEGQAKVLDFGLARRLQTGDLTTETISNISQTGDPPMAGTLGYLSPEVLQGKPASVRSDIWALGVVFHEMASGELPFTGRTGYELTSSILREPPKPLSERIPQGVKQIIHRCLVKEPEERYHQAAELRAAFDVISSSRPAHSLLASRFARRIAALTLSVIAAVATTYFVHGFKHESANAMKEKPILLALIPSRTQDADEATTALGNGLIENLTVKLTMLSENHLLEVIPASEMQATGVRSLEQARRDLGADLGLEVSVQRSGNMIRTSYILIDTKTMRPKRADTITGSASDPFAIEDELASSVANALAINLKPEEKQLLTSRGTTQPAAYDFYLQGRGYLQDFYNPESVKNAIQVFNHALETDPNYAPALAGLGQAYWYEYELTKQPGWIERARSSCNLATTKLSEKGDGHVCLGLVYNGTGEHKSAMDQYLRAVEMAPTDERAYAGLAIAYEGLGQIDSAETTFKKAISLRPNYSGGYNALGAFYLRHARYGDAEGMFSQMIALAPDSVAGYTNLGSTYLVQDRYAEALPMLERSVAIRPTGDAESNLATAYFQLHRFPESALMYEKAVKLDDQNYELWGNLGDAYYWTPGMRDRAPVAYRTAIHLAVARLKVNPQDATVLGYMAGYYAMLGDKRKALSTLDRALQFTAENADVLTSAAIVYNQFQDTEMAILYLRRAISAGASRATLRELPNFDNLREDSRFRQLLDVK
jgi:serine/threonine protein kinase/tetratricopeptide (TPR) repeat protein